MLDDRAERVDVAGFENTQANFESWVREEAAVRQRLSQLYAKEKAATALFELADVTPGERREAEATLTACREKLARLHELLERAKTLQTVYSERIARMKPAYTRQRERELLAAKLRKAM